MSFVLVAIESNLRSLTEAFPLKLCVQHHGDMWNFCTSLVNAKYCHSAVMEFGFVI
jgi:hypothetical protein